MGSANDMYSDSYLNVILKNKLWSKQNICYFQINLSLLKITEYMSTAEKCKNYD